MQIVYKLDQVLDQQLDQLLAQFMVQEKVVFIIKNKIIRNLN